MLLELVDCYLSSVWKTFGHYLFKYFFCSFSPPGTPTTCTLDEVTQSPMSLKLFFFFPFLFLSELVLFSTELSFSSLVLVIFVVPSLLLNSNLNFRYRISQL